MNVITNFKLCILQVVPALCLTIFQFSACAQTKPESPTLTQAETSSPTQSLKQALAAPAATVKQTVAPLFENVDFSALNTEMLCSPEALIEYFTVAPQQTTPKQPNIHLMPAKVEVAAVPPAQKLNDVRFAEPELNGKHAPKTFNASAYALRGRTRSGVRTEKGVLAADPRVLPLGTVVQVNAGKYSGVYTVHDTGGAIKGNRLDVWVPSTKEALRFGRRKVKLVVLRYPGQNKPVAQK